VLQLGIEFDDLPLLQLLPADRRRRPSTKSEEKFLDLVQRKTSLPRPLNHDQAMQHGDIVYSASAYSRCWRKNSDVFVVADRRRMKSDPSGDLRNTQRHGAIIDEAPALLSTSFLRDKEFTKLHLALKSASSLSFVKEARV